jgi:hypothetical protein
MSQGSLTTTVYCPRCRHPYPMTATQLSVYRGRTMGCMACGRPFEVRPPDPEPDPPATVAEDPGAAGEWPLAGGTVAAERPGEEEDVAAVRSAVPARAGTAWAGADRAEVPAAARLGASTPARAGIAAALACLILVAAAGVVGYAALPPVGPSTAQSAAASLLLLRLAVGCAAVAAGIGAVLLWRGRRSGSKGPADRRTGADGHAVVSRYAVAALGLGLAELAAAALLAFVAWPPMARGLADSHRATCQGNLEQLGAAALSEATGRADGRFPDSLADLVAGGKLFPAATCCPADPRPDAANGTAPNPGPVAGAGGPPASYVYLGKGLTTRAGGGARVSTHTVLAYEVPGHHGDAGGVHVLFADGTVVFADKDQAAALLAELAAGQNPPPAAALVRR